MRFLLTGFDPFGGENVNPAFEAVKMVSDTIQGYEIIKLELPTVYKKSVQILDDAIEKYQPDYVLAIGQAGGRSAIAVERVGINIDDARIKDNEGNQPIDEIIFEDGQTAYFSNLPIKAMVEAMQKKGIPSIVSNSAGTFVCNHILYSIMYLVDKKYSGVKGGFIHVPFIPEQVISKPNQPSMALEMITKGIEVAIETAIQESKDKKIVGGSIY
jgi:pyroglutamyl-peptidase